MHIDKSLNLVLEVDRDDGVKLHVHSTPISSETYEDFWEPISLVFSRIMQDGHNVVTGPRIADKMLKKISKEKGVWDTPGGVEKTLLPEIRRRTNVLVPGPKGWELYPFDDARKRDMISVEDAKEVESRLIFFTVFSHEMTKSEKKSGLFEAAIKMSGGEITFLGCTEFSSSLPTSTEAASSGTRAAA